MALTFAAEAQNFLVQDLHPMMMVVTDMARLIGITMVFIGLTRLHRMASNNMMYRVSPISTMFYFLGGATLTAFTPMLSAIAIGLFGAHNNEIAYGFGHAVTSCLGQSSLAGGATNNVATNYPVCPIMGYAQVLKSTPTSDVSAEIRIVAFATMFVIGALSFIRGVGLLVKTGEGGQPGTVARSATHIIAGAVGVNAPAVYYFLTSVYHATTGM